MEWTYNGRMYVCASVRLYALLVTKQSDMISRNWIETEAGTLYEVRQIFKLLNDS